MTPLPAEMDAIIITAAGAPEVLKSCKIRVPFPAQGQVLLRISAAGVNRHDCNQRAKGQHHDGNPVPGLEASGLVVALGEGVTDLAVGDRVMALLQGGGYAEYAIANVPMVMPVPDGMSILDAAGCPEALFTAWWNFFGIMRLRKQEFSLIHGGTSGVGHLALKAMSVLGYRVLATAGSDKKVHAARKFGAYAAFNYNDPKLAEKVLDKTSQTGISALLDMSAGAHVSQDIAMMAPDGRIAHLSGGGGSVLELPLMAMMAKRIRITGSLLRPLAFAEKAKIAEQLKRDVLPVLGKQVSPSIAAIYPLAAAAEAHRQMEKGNHIGKILLNAADQE